MRERVLGVERFTVDVPQPTLDDLAERLARTRWPGDLDGPGWGGLSSWAFAYRGCPWLTGRC
jgi:hypothetical protein